MSGFIATEAVLVVGGTGCVKREIIQRIGTKKIHALKSTIKRPSIKLGLDYGIVNADSVIRNTEIGKTLRSGKR